MNWGAELRARGISENSSRSKLPCADDEEARLNERAIAARAAVLCEAAEKASRDLSSRSPQPVYVIGAEVPTPGGEVLGAQGSTATPADDVHRTLEVFHEAFLQRGLSSAWERVVALVVQPGVDFGADAVFDYDGSNAGFLSAALATHDGIVYEAHSTDDQSDGSLAQMVRDHFAILKVGPWLTFAFRDAVLGFGHNRAGCRDRSSRRQRVSMQVAGFRVIELQPY